MVSHGLIILVVIYLQVKFNIIELSFFLVWMSDVLWCSNEKCWVRRQLSLALIVWCSLELLTAWKVSRYGVIFGPYFPVFGYRKIRTRNNFVFGHFSHSDCFQLSENMLGNVTAGISFKVKLVKFYVDMTMPKNKFHFRNISKF